MKLKLFQFWERILHMRWTSIFQQLMRRKNWTSTFTLTTRTYFLSYREISISCLRNSSRFWCASKAKTRKSKSASCQRSSRTKFLKRSTCQSKAILTFRILETPTPCTLFGEKTSTNDLLLVFTSKLYTYLIIPLLLWYCQS